MALIKSRITEFHLLSNKRTLKKNMGTVSNMIFGKHWHPWFMSQTEKDFNKHNELFQPALAELKIIQTEEQKQKFLMKTLKRVSNQEPITPVDIVNAVDGVDSESTANIVVAFTKQVSKVSDAYPLVPNAFGNFMEVVKVTWSVDITKASEASLAVGPIKLQNTPEYEALVKTFVENTHLGSDNIFESLRLLQKFADSNEVLTFLACHPMLAKGLGLKLFLVGYYQFGIDGSFKGFISDTHSAFEKKLTPVYRTIRLTGQFVYHNKFTFLTSFSTVGLATYFFNISRIEVKPLLTEAAVVITPPTPKTIFPPSKWSPKNFYVDYAYSCVRDTSTTASYMIANFFGSNVMASREGAMDAAFSEEAKHAIDKAAADLVPKVIDKITKSL